MKTKESKQRPHADFQNAYHRSSNFRKITKDESFTPKGNGKVKLNPDGFSEEEKKEISNAMDRMQQRMEMTPGGEQTDREEE
ncbi:hypothetical protein, partial [Altibacter sp.]|uniref:hypothetical protein n=1 Tax=Altibacter sp. TaxID=2024823 RepID=UPI000C8EEFF9